MKDNPIVAIFPGTFDPITLGHEDLIKRAASIFDKVWIAVAHAHHKKTLLNLPTRLNLVKGTCAQYENIEVLSFEGLLSDVIRQKSARVLLRGIRSNIDFEYEFNMAGINCQIMPNIETLFLPSREPYRFISSSYVREISMLGGDVSQWVSSDILETLKRERI